MVIDNLSTVEELIEEWIKIGKECPSLTHYLVKSLLEISDRLLEDISSVELEIAGDSFPLFSININHLSRRPDYFEVLF